QILRWRQLKRDLAFLEAGSKTDRVHPVWRLTRTSTGRITASDPPVQNLDKKRFRHFLIPADGCVLIKADWKACQARILGHGGMHLTKVATTYSVWAHGRLPEILVRVRSSFFDRGRVQRLSFQASLARRFSMLSLWTR